MIISVAIYQRNVAKAHAVQKLAKLRATHVDKGNVYPMNGMGWCRAHWRNTSLVGIEAVSGLGLQRFFFTG